MNRELVIERIFDAPRERVWQAWTDPEEATKWWGPQGVTTPTFQWDNRPQGPIYIVMLAGEELGSMEGTEWPMTGVVQEVVEPEKLVFTGNAIMDDEVILENLCTVLFEEQGSKTKMTLRIEVTKTTPEAKGALEGMEVGWNQSIDKLAAFLAL